MGMPDTIHHRLAASTGFLIKFLLQKFFRRLQTVIIFAAIGRSETNQIGRLIQHFESSGISKAVFIQILKRRKRHPEIIEKLLNSAINYLERRTKFQLPRLHARVKINMDNILCVLPEENLSMIHIDPLYHSPV